MIKGNVTYFEKPGRENTEATLKLAVETAKELGIKNIVLASTEGYTAEMMANDMGHEGLDITVVTTAYGQKEAGKNRMPEEVRAGLKAKGFHVCTAAHALSGAERALSTSFHGAYPVEIIAHTLRMFGQGTKVCVEIGAMAADAGYVVSGEPVIAIGGSAKGADTAVVIRPEVTSKILQTKIDRIICMPIE